MSSPYSNSEEFVLAYHRPTDGYYVGIVTQDKRCRVDFHGKLSELTFWDVMWNDPKNPWNGGFTTYMPHSKTRRNDLTADYT